MKLMRPILPARHMVLAVLVCVAFGSCSRNNEMVPLKLPATHILSASATWAVITSSYLRIREKPTVNSKAVTTLWKGFVLEVVSRGGTRDTVQGISDYWYQISYDGISGWAFGGYLNVFDSKEQAEAAAQALSK